MTAFQIKIIAIVTMIADHTGVFLFPQYAVFRIIGRLSFPLFAWLIANGARYTKNIYHYLFRLLAFGVISQISYRAAHQLIDPEYNILNILFTLSFGLVAIIIYKKVRRRIYFLPILIICLFIAEKMNVEFGSLGVLSIFCFYVFRDKVNILIISQLVIYFSRFSYYAVLLFPKNAIEIMFEYDYFAPFAVLSLIIIFLYNNKRGAGLKYLFYIIYPLQYAVFYFLKKYLGF